VVRLHGQDVVAAPPGDVVGGLPLAVHRICGDDGAGDVHAVQQIPQRGDLVALGGYREQAEDGAGGLVGPHRRCLNRLSRLTESRPASVVRVDGDRSTNPGRIRPPGDSVA